MRPTEVITQEWQEYKSTGDREVRNRLVLHYSSLVRYVALKVGSGLPSTVERDDLISYGMFGLIDAIDKFDLSKGVKFETYAISRIKGSIIDELRSMDWVPRSVRAKARDVERVYADAERELGRPPTEIETAERLGITLPELWAVQAQAARASVGALDEDSGDDEHRHFTDVFDASSNPEDIIAVEEITERLSEAVMRMTERSKTILVLYYVQEMTLAEIGEVLGVTESRVCQLQSKVLQGLRDHLRNGQAVAA